MNIDDFRKHGHELVDWMADFLRDVREYPVKPNVNPGDIKKHIPELPPENGQPFEEIFQDFNEIIMPGMTHWQSPHFFAYFPANSSPPSVLAEMLTATLGAQCMIWQTSPSAAELEERMMQWLGKMIGLPSDFEGVIQDTASTATLCSILTAREKYSRLDINKSGFDQKYKFAVYCSSETHSSIEKDVKIAGIGSKNIRKIPVDDKYALIPAELENAIIKDIENGIKPLCVVATIGTTGSTAIDPLKEIAVICRKHDIWLHVDAAYAGTALLLPEMRWMIDGIEDVDTFVFNPHKWMFTNFDCSAYFVKDKEALIRTFEILPEYLKTSEKSPVNNYRDWGIQLGRRFRALKLWFVIRTYGVNGLQSLIKKHLALAQDFKAKLESDPSFEIIAPIPLNVICFRYHPKGTDNGESLNRINNELLEKINSTGKIFLTHTKLDEKYVIRMVTAQTQAEQKDIDLAWDIIKSISKSLQTP